MADPNRVWVGLAIATVLCGLVIVLVQTAWLCDDAYITFRTVDNFQSGHGLTWNSGERVQPYTHPLWMLLVLLVTGATGELYHSVLGLGIVLTVATAVVVIRTFGRSLASFSVLLIFTFSRAFIDYSTSGLEDPLSHFLLASYLFLVLRSNWDSIDRKSVFWFALIAGLAVTTRMDTALLYFPSLLALFWRYGRQRTVLPILAGFAPFIAWEVFSLIYYGFPFPNSAYAKLNIDIPAGELFARGMAYLADSVRSDPLTCIVILTGLALTCFRRVRGTLLLRGTLPLAIGTLLYIGYVVRVGGDFMSGRMLSLPLCAAAILLGNWIHSLQTFRAAFVPAIVVVVGLLAPVPTTVSSKNFVAAAVENAAPYTVGILDERGFYYTETGLLSEPRLEYRRTNEHKSEISHSWAQAGLAARLESVPVVIKQTVGFFGYYAGPEVYVIDKHALSDPLLARVPRIVGSKKRTKKFWRAGHFKRYMPDGYTETVGDGANSIEPAQLADYYSRLQPIVRGPLFTGERWRAIWKFNTGGYDELMESYVNWLDERHAEKQ